MFQKVYINKVFSAANKLKEFYDSPDAANSKIGGKSKSEIFEQIDLQYLNFAQTSLRDLALNDLTYESIDWDYKDAFRKSTYFCFDLDYYSGYLEKLELYGRPMTEDLAIVVLTFALKKTLESRRIDTVANDWDDPMHGKYLEDYFNTFCFEPLESIIIKESFAPILYQAVALKVTQEMAASMVLIQS
ncbi:MAG TPA: hypothetical protein DCL21_02850 [Alphaproteobacteria bacterium]|nr:hypothetical protein [Alphaproteobacteria bacterium]